MKDRVHRRSFLASVGATALLSGANQAVPNDRARRLHERSTVIVIHDHRPIAPDVPLMLAGGVTAKLYQIGVDVEPTANYAATASSREGWARRTEAALEEALRTIEADPDHLLLARTAEDIVRAKREHKLAILLGVEGGKLLEGKLDKLGHFHRLGLRELQLRWAVPNQLVEQDSLTDFGVAVVKECNRLGIIVDLTHIPERAFFQAVEVARKPLIVSHGTGRELGDARVDAIARSRGVIGIHFYSSYLGPRPTVVQVLDAIDHVAPRVGAETFALGVDFFPTTGGWRDFQLAQGTKDISWAIPDLSHMESVTCGLVDRNYTDKEIEEILGGNFLRVCRECFGG